MAPVPGAVIKGATPEPIVITLLLLSLACTSKGGDDSGGSPTEDGGSTATGDGVGLSELSAAVDPLIGSMVRVSWTQAGPGEVALEYLLDGAWLAAPLQSREAGSHELLIPGIPFDHDTAVRASADGQLSEELSLRTAERPASIPELELLASDPGAFDSSVAYFLISINQAGTYYDGPWWTLIIDRQGRVVWALETPADYSTLWALPARDGRSLLIDHNSFWTLFDRAATSRIVRIGLDGSELEQFDTPGMGHAFVELPDGRIAWPGNVEGDERLALVGGREGPPGRLSPHLGGRRRGDGGERLGHETPEGAASLKSGAAVVSPSLTRRSKFIK
jgi:hypothetical protein